MIYTVIKSLHELQSTDTEQVHTQQGRQLLHITNLYFLQRGAAMQALEEKHKSMYHTCKECKKEVR